jgi:hypothetical protein
MSKRRPGKPSKPGDSFDLVEKVRVKCSCGLWVTCGYQDDGEPALIHPVPACAFYMQTDPVIFLRTLRKRYSP